MSDQMLTVDDILGAEDLTTIDVEIPEWPKNGNPGVIRLKTMTAKESIFFTKSMQNNPQNRDNAMIRLIQRCAITDAGDPLFTEAQVKALSEKSVRVFNKLQKAALELNGFTDLAEQAAKNG